MTGGSNQFIFINSVEYPLVMITARDLDPCAMIAAAAPRRFIPISTHLAGGGEGQYPQLREQAVMYCGVLHLVILSMVVLTSR